MRRSPSPTGTRRQASSSRPAALHPTRSRDVTLQRVHVLTERAQVSTVRRVDGAVVVVAALVAEETGDDVKREEGAGRDEKLHLSSVHEIERSRGAPCENDARWSGLAPHPSARGLFRGRTARGSPPRRRS